MPHSGTERLVLKWGTLKGWDFDCDNHQALLLLQEYREIGVSLGAMSQRDTERQKEIICALIDLCDGSIINDWSGENYTDNREAAKEYVRNYGKKVAPPKKAIEEGENTNG